MPPPPRLNIRLQPYLLQDVRATSAVVTGAPQVGGEVKWAITPNDVLDLTVNTDFAQADVDRQVINLTRFSVFFPERRQFFWKAQVCLRLAPTTTFSRFSAVVLGLMRLGIPFRLMLGRAVCGEPRRKTLDCSSFKHALMTGAIFRKADLPSHDSAAISAKKIA